MITAIISEFNPITNGHEHIIKKAKANGETVLCLMSGNFVQRGEGAILPKHVRAKMAILAGADLVCELPIFFACSNAETFAHGAMKLLSQIPAVSKVIFGSESGDIAKLQERADFVEDKKFQKTLAKNLKKGDTFSKAKAISESECGFEFSKTPNDILGVEYIRAGKRVGFSGTFETIQRVGSNHDEKEIKNGFASASMIRELISSGNIEKVKPLMPKNCYEILKSTPAIDCSSLGILASFQGITAKHRKDISEVSEGLENLMYQSGFNGFESYALNIKSKRYTLARIKRMSIKNVLNITKEDVKFAVSHIKFLIVLAVSKNSTDIFSEDFGLTLIKRGKDIEKLGKKQRKIYEKMKHADLVYSIFSGKLQTQMEVCE